MKSIITVLIILFNAGTSFATLDCHKSYLHAMDVATCTFLEVLRNKSNPEIESAKKYLAEQGYSHVNTGEDPNAVFIRGHWATRYTYLVTTDVSSKIDSKSIGAIISVLVNSEISDREVRIEKVITSDSL